MEVRYPILLILLIIVFIFYMVLIKGKKKNYESGTKIANTHYLKRNSRFQKKNKILSENHYSNKIFMYILHFHMFCFNF